MDRTSASRRETLFRLDGRPPIGAAVSMALQHLVAMIVGCVTPAIIVANTVGLGQEDRVLLIQASLVASAVSTLLQLYPIAGRFGSGLPVIMGISFAYVPSMQAAASAGGVSAIAGAMVVGGAVALLVGIFVRQIRTLFPPVITGTVIFTIGLSLYPTAINYMAGGSGNTYDLVVTQQGLPEALVYGSWQNWLVAAVTLAAVLALNHYTRGFCKMASILLGMAVGYAVALCFGMVDFSGVASSGWAAAPEVLPFGMTFDLASCVSIGLLFAVNSIQAIGDFTATTVGGLGREPTDRELQGGILCYGATNILCAFFGGCPPPPTPRTWASWPPTRLSTAPSLPSPASSCCWRGSARSSPSVLTTIPQCVLGGATVTVFSTIAMTGMKLITAQDMTARNTTIVGLSAALGVAYPRRPPPWASSRRR